MKKNDWKCLIDALLFVDVCSIGVIGLLMAFIVPSGRVPDASKFFMGLHRHQWGEIHLYLSILLLGLLVLHIRFNWTRVVNSARSYFGEHWRNALWSVAGAWVVVLLLAWIIVKL